MENASKALIMAAEILIGIILLSIFVLAFQSCGNFADRINDNIEITNIQEFNSKFTIYEGKDLRIHDIISIKNLVDEYNNAEDENGNTRGDYYEIKIIGNANIKLKNLNDEMPTYEDKIFLVRITKYNEETGLVKEIRIDIKKIT